MNRLAKIMTVAALAITTHAVTTQAATKRVKVFILAGQSNMVGHGKVEDGRNPDYDAEKPGSKKEIPGGIDIPPCGLYCYVLLTCPCGRISFGGPSTRATLGGVRSCGATFLARATPR